MTEHKPTQEFFDSFGYAVFKNCLSNEIGSICEEFERVVGDDGAVQHGRACGVIGETSVLYATFLRDKLSPLLSSAVGPRWTFLGGDCSRFCGDTGWHRDGPHPIGRYVAVAMYLDSVQAETGCLRVVPGLHRTGLDQYWDASEKWGIKPCDVPSVPVPSEPGDVIVFDHNLPHASFGGRMGRRMIKLNFAVEANAEPKLSIEPRIMDEVLKWLNGSDRPSNRSFDYDSDGRPDEPLVTTGIDRIVEQVLARKIIASDLYAKNNDSEDLEFVGRILCSPFPVLIMRKEH